MVLLVWLLIVESLIFLLILPIKTSVKASVNFVEQKAIFAVKIFNLTPIIFKVEKLKEQFRLSVNGKNLYKKKNDKSENNKTSKAPLNYVNLAKDLWRLVEKVDFIGIVGGDDAFETALRHAIFSNLFALIDSKIDRFLLLPNYERNVLNLDVEVKFRFTIFDVIELVGAYGSKRSIKANNRQFERSHQQ